MLINSLIKRTNVNFVFKIFLKKWFKFNLFSILWLKETVINNERDCGQVSVGWVSVGQACQGNCIDSREQQVPNHSDAGLTKQQFQDYSVYCCLQGLCQVFIVIVYSYIC